MFINKIIKYIQKFKTDLIFKYNGFYLYYMTNAEQINKYELTADQVLDLLKLDKKKWKAEKDFSSSAVKNIKSDKEYKNTQLYEWVFSEKVNGKWIKRKIDTSKILSKSGYNNYARSGDNGIVIIQPLSLAKAEKIKPVENKGSEQSALDNSISNSSDSSLDGNGDSFSSFRFQPTNYKGNDEDIIKHISFAKLCLLKECYESLGILL